MQAKLRATSIVNRAAWGGQSYGVCGSWKKRTAKLKKLMSDLSLDKIMLQDVLTKEL